MYKRAARQKRCRLLVPNFSRLHTLCLSRRRSACHRIYRTIDLIIRWRLWLTNNYVGRWLDNHTHYRMSLAGGAADNPDQRISEDINRFIDGGQVGMASTPFRSF